MPTVAEQREFLKREEDRLAFEMKKRQDELAEEGLTKNAKGGNDFKDAAHDALNFFKSLEQRMGANIQAQTAREEKDKEKGEQSTFGKVTAEGLQHDIKMIMDFLQKLADQLEERMQKDRELEQEVKKDEKAAEDLKEKEQALNDPGLKPKDPAPEASLTDQQKEEEEKRKEQEAEAAKEKKEKGEEEKKDETKEAEKPKAEEETQEEEKKQGPRLGG